MDDRIEKILSEMADAEAAAEVRLEAGRATESDPEAARTARDYERLSQILGAWRTLPQAVDWNALTARVSQSVATDQADGDQSRGADDLLTQWAKPLPQVDWNALSARISRAVRAEAVEKRRRSVREALGAWGLRVAGPLAVAAALAFAAIWWLPACPTNTFQSLKRMKPLRQIEVAELMIAMDNYSVSYSKALLAATPQDQLIESEKPKSFKGISAEQIAQMESEMAKLQREMKLIEDSYGPDHLNLVLARGYLVTLLENQEVSRYLAKNHSEIVSEFRRISEVVSMGSEEKV